MESHKRSIVKTMSWRIIATIVTFTVAYLFTKEVVLATGIGLADATIKIVAYYSHERMWNGIGFGIKEE